MQKQNAYQRRNLTRKRLRPDQTSLCQGRPQHWPSPVIMLKIISGMETECTETCHAWQHVLSTVSAHTTFCISSCPYMLRNHSFPALTSFKISLTFAWRVSRKDPFLCALSLAWNSCLVPVRVSAWRAQGPEVVAKSVCGIRLWGAKRESKRILI